MLAAALTVAFCDADDAGGFRRSEDLGALGTEERRTVYSMPGLRVEALPDGVPKVGDAFGEEAAVWAGERTARRFSSEANLPARKAFGFTLILREGVAPKAAFGVLGGL